jgi:hypothetical protein
MVFDGSAHEWTKGSGQRQNDSKRLPIIFAGNIREALADYGSRALKSAKCEKYCRLRASAQPRIPVSAARPNWRASCRDPGKNFPNIQYGFLGDLKGRASDKRKHRLRRSMPAR